MIEIKNGYQMLKDFKLGTINMTKNGKCTGCGDCCSNLLPLTKNEIKEIKRYIKVHNIREQKHSFVGFSDPNCLDMMCPFLNIGRPDKKCMIYEARPSICRDFVCSKTKEEIAHEVLTNTGTIKDLEYVITPMREEFFGR